MKAWICALIVATLYPLALAQPPAKDGSSARDAMWDEYDPVLHCVIDKSVGHSYNEDPAAMVPQLLSVCQGEVTAARGNLKQMGYTADSIAAFEGDLHDTLLKTFTDEFAKKQAEVEPERAYARSIYRAALSCASKLAIDYKELGAGDPAVFYEFINGQCSFRKEIEAGVSSGLDSKAMTSAGLAAKTCGFAKALDNLKYRLDPETADTYKACPAYVEMIYGRAPPP